VSSTFHCWSAPPSCARPKPPRASKSWSRGGFDALHKPYQKRLHEAIARALEALHGADLAPHALALGRHYYASEAWDRAAGYLAQAGTSAVARSAHREAAACFEQAIQALQHLPPSRAMIERTIDLRFKVRQSCVPLRDHTRVLDHLRKAEAEAETIDDRARLGWAFAYRVHGLFLSGDSQGAIEAGQHSVAIAEVLDAIRAQIGLRYPGEQA